MQVMTAVVNADTVQDDGQRDPRSKAPGCSRPLHVSVKYAIFRWRVTDRGPCRTTASLHLSGVVSRALAGRLDGTDEMLGAPVRADEILLRQAPLWYRPGPSCSPGAGLATLVAQPGNETVPCAISPCCWILTSSTVAIGNRIADSSIVVIGTSPRPRTSTVAVAR